MLSCNLWGCARKKWLKLETRNLQLDSNDMQAEDFVFATAALAARSEDGTDNHKTHGNGCARMREARKQRTRIDCHSWNWEKHNDPCST
jgi:hypothetical protein